MFNHTAATGLGIGNIWLHGLQGSRLIDGWSFWVRYFHSMPRRRFSCLARQIWLAWRVVMINLVMQGKQFGQRWSSGEIARSMYTNARMLVPTRVIPVQARQWQGLFRRALVMRSEN